MRCKVREAYLQSISLIERLHRRFLDVIKCELDNLGVDDINNVQSLILYNIGEDEVTVGELTNRGYYLGTNVTYNLKKLVEYGYVQQERSTRDRRSVRISLADRGKDLCQKMSAIFDHQAEDLTTGALDPEILDAANEQLRALEQFWTTELAKGSMMSRGSRAA